MTRQSSSFLIVCFALLTIASATSASAQTETVVHSFRGNSGTDAIMPFGGLVPDSSGALYSTATGGGKYGYGAIYKLAPPTTQGGVEAEHSLLIRGFVQGRE